MQTIIIDWNVKKIKQLKLKHNGVICVKIVLASQAY